MNEIVWISENRHIIVALTKPIFSYHDKTYSVFREYWDYTKFDSDEFHNVTWFFERWEDTLEEAIEYTKCIPDEPCKIYI